MKANEKMKIPEIIQATAELFKKSQRAKGQPTSDLHFHRMIPVVVQQGDRIASEDLAVEG
jgi:hypothetical protein